MSDQVVVAEDLFVWPAEPTQLMGARCRSCGVLNFPRTGGCPRCGSEDAEPALLPAEGTVWAWTSQEFLPKEPYLGANEPDAFTPWYVGLVELGGEIRVEGRLVDCTAETLRIGLPVRTVVVPFAHDDDGNELLTFAFAPSAAPTAPADEQPTTGGNA